MTADIGQELLELITGTFEKSLRSSKQIAKLTKRIDTSAALNYKDADEYAKEVGNLLAKSIRLHVDSDVLPGGKMYYNIANTILTDRLARNHELVTNVTNKVQQSMNDAWGVGMKARTPKLNQDRLDGLLEMLSSAEKFDAVADSLGVSVINFTQSIITDAVQENFEFQSKSGMRPILVRETDGNCCAWCDRMAGVYRYPVDKKVYARHQSCTCTVTYYPGDGTKQDSYTKKRATATKDEYLGQIKKSMMKARN